MRKKILSLTNEEAESFCEHRRRSCADCPLSVRDADIMGRPCLKPLIAILNNSDVETRLDTEVLIEDPSPEISSAASLRASTQALSGLQESVSALGNSFERIGGWVSGLLGPYTSAASRCYRDWLDAYCQYGPDEDSHH